MPIEDTVISVGIGYERHCLRTVHNPRMDNITYSRPPWCGLKGPIVGSVPTPARLVQTNITPVCNCTIQDVSARRIRKWRYWVMSEKDEKEKRNPFERLIDKAEDAVENVFDPDARERRHSHHQRRYEDERTQITINVNVECCP